MSKLALLKERQLKGLQTWQLCNETSFFEPLATSKQTLTHSPATAVVDTAVVVADAVDATAAAVVKAVVKAVVETVTVVTAAVVMDTN